MRNSFTLLLLVLPSILPAQFKTRANIYYDDGTVKNGKIVYCFNCVSDNMKFWPDGKKKAERLDITQIDHIDVNKIGTYRRLQTRHVAGCDCGCQGSGMVNQFLKLVYTGYPFSLYEEMRANGEYYFWHNEESSITEQLQFKPVYDLTKALVGFQPDIEFQVRRESQRYGVTFPFEELRYLSYEEKALLKVLKILNKDSTANRRPPAPAIISKDRWVAGIWVSMGQPFYSKAFHDQAFYLRSPTHSSGGIYIGRDLYYLERLYSRPGIGFGFGRFKSIGDSIKGREINTAIQTYSIRPSYGIYGLLNPKGKMNATVGVNVAYNIPFYCRQMSVDGQVHESNFKKDENYVSAFLDLELAVFNNLCVGISYGGDFAGISAWGTEGVATKKFSGRFNVSYKWQ